MLLLIGLLLVERFAEAKISAIQSDDYLNECINRLHSNDNDWILTDSSVILRGPVVIWAHFNRTITFEMCKFNMYIFTAENSIDLQTKLQHLHEKRTFNTRAKFLVISRNLAGNASVAAILNKYYTFNVAVVEEKSPNRQFIYGYELYCNGSVDYICPGAKLLDKCVNGTLISGGRKVFQGKLPHKWPNTTVKAIYSEIPPYIIAEEGKQPRGILIDLFNTVINVLNGRIEYVYMPTLEYRGRNRFGHYKKVLNLLEQQWADLLLGFNKPEFEEHIDFDVSCACIEDEEHFVVPHSTKIPYWKRLVVVFQNVSLFLLAFSGFLIVFQLYIVYRMRFLASVAVFFQILVENPSISFVNLPSRFVSCRILLTFWLLSALVISTTFRNRMMLILLMDKYEYNIGTLSEIERSNKQIYWRFSLDEDFYQYSNDTFENHISNRIIYTNDLVFAMNLTAFTKTCFTTALKRTFFHYLPKYYTNKEGEPMLHLVEERIASWHGQFVLTKGYPLYEQINRLLMQLKSNGFIFNLYDKYRFMSFKQFLNNFNRKMDNFTLRNLQPAFVVLVFGYALAVLAFFTEFMHFYN